MPGIVHIAELDEEAQTLARLAVNTALLVLVEQAGGRIAIGGAELSKAAHGPHRLGVQFGAAGLELALLRLDA